MKAIRTITKHSVNAAYPNKTEYIGFLVKKVINQDGSYTGVLEPYALTEVLATDGITVLGYSLNQRIMVDDIDMLKTFSKAEVQTIYNQLVTDGIINPTVDDYFIQEDKLNYEGAKSLIVSYNLFGISLITDLETITLLENQNI